jgi:hypothetical protein
MGLMCGCDSDWYPEPGDWTWGASKDYAPLSAKRRKRCCSCNELIDVGALSIEFCRVRIPDTDIEVRIYGEDGEIPIASNWMCEKCGDLYLSLEAIGYCMNPRDDMGELLKEHVARTNLLANGAGA